MRSGKPHVASALPLLLLDGDAARSLVLEVALQPILDRLQQVTGICVQGHDITERQEAVARLAELNASLEAQVHERTVQLLELAEREHAILASAASAIIATDLAAQVTSFNPAAEAMLRVPAAQALGSSALAFFDVAELLEHAPALPQEVRDNGVDGLSVQIGALRDRKGQRINGLRSYPSSRRTTFRKFLSCNTNFVVTAPICTESPSTPIR